MTEVNPDPWMLQIDVRQLLETTPVDDKGYLTIYDTTESHLERRFTIVNPLARRSCFAAIKRDHTFNEDIERARFPVVCRYGYTHDMRIAPRFWRKFKKLALDAVLGDDGAVLFEWRPGHSGRNAVTNVRMRQDILRDDLRRHHLCGLWCTESMRFSERSISELGLSEIREVFQSNDFIYQLFIGDRPEIKFRMQTVSVLLGKRVIFAN
ncbi:MAG: hypothetical protein DMF70_16565 [Acidobacteria bacterium]|nr:MAG: hypothetical protein DMF70_16565 [Acidobacteriota bacterium]